MPGETQRQVIDRITLSGMRAMRGQENQNVAQLVKAYRGAQDEINRTLQGVFASTSTPGTWNMAEMASAGRDVQMFQAVQGQIQNLQNTQVGQLEAGVVDQFRSSIDRAGYALDQGTPLAYSVRLPILPEDQIRALVNTPFEGAMFSQRLGLVSNETATAIQNQLTRSMINGESMSQAASRVDKVLGASNLADPKGAANRSMTIARTEIMRAQNMGKMAVFQSNSDIIEGNPQEAWVWVVTPDDRLCPWCRRREGKTPAQIKRMPTGRDPWGRSTSMPLHPHCRCTSYPKLKTFRELGIDMPENFGDDERGMRDPVTGKWKVQSIETFDDWMATQ